MKYVIYTFFILIGGTLGYLYGFDKGSNKLLKGLEETEKYNKYCEEVIYCQDSLINNQLEIMSCSEVHYHKGMLNIDSLMCSHSNLIERVNHLKNYKR